MMLIKNQWKLKHAMIHCHADCDLWSDEWQGWLSEILNPFVANVGSLK
jgi:hypothetical protein